MIKVFNLVLRVFMYYARMKLLLRAIFLYSRKINRETRKRK